jgi:hypothetical protein
MMMIIGISIMTSKLSSSSVGVCRRSAGQHVDAAVLPGFVSE